MKINQCISARSEITQLEVLDGDKAAISTKEHGIKIFSIDKCKLIKSLSGKTLSSKTTALTFSPNGKILAYANSDTIYVIEVSTHKLIKTIQINSEEIEILRFDPSSTYVVAGTKNGRVFQYKHDNSSLLSRLCSFPYQTESPRSKIRKNFVSSFAFYKQKVACSGYDGAIFIIDLLSRANKKVLSHARVRIDALCFLDENTIISGNVDGVIQITPLKDERLHRRINAPFTKITQILPMPNPNYVMVSSNSDYLAIVDIKNYKILDSKYLEFEDKISKIALCSNETLLVGLENFKLLRVELPSAAQLQSLITGNYLEEAFKLVISEPMLRDSIEHKKLQDIYQKRYEKAANALLRNNVDAAKGFVDEFANVPSKKEEIYALFKGFEEYPKFISLVFGYKYSLAYAMSVKYPALKQTSPYKEMEKSWKEAFSDAQRQMLQNREEIAKKTLTPYMTTTSKRALIKFILNDNKKFLEFLKAIENREFETMEKLAKEFETFTQIPTYVALRNKLEDNVKKAKEYVNLGKVALAKGYLEKMKETPSFQDITLKLYRECENVNRLQAAYDKNELRACYEMLDSHKRLSETVLGGLLEERWSKLISKAEAYALNGDMRGVKQTLGHLIKVRSRVDKIGELLRISFHVKIKQLLSKKNLEKANAIIRTYLDTFGVDTEISEIIELFTQNGGVEIDLTPMNRKYRKRDNWIKSAYFNKLS